MFEKLKKIILLTGHYGSGKTNFAVNLAFDYKRTGEMVKIVDLDIVNPYFRTADFSALLNGEGIEVVAPYFANSLLDIPSLPREVSGALTGDGRIIVDVGGDDAGAAVLGRYHADILKADGADMLYLFSVFRPGTGSPEEVFEHIRAVEAASRQKVTYLVNSSNLGAETEQGDIERSLSFAKKLADLTEIPLLTTVALKSFSGNIENSYAVKRFVRLPWEPEEKV